MMRAKSSIEAEYCIALRARTNSGMPFGSQPLKRVMVVSVIMIPAALTPKSSPLWIRPGEAVHQDAVAVRRRDVEDRCSSARRHVAGPVVVAHNDAAVFRIAAGGDERAAVLGAVSVAGRRQLVSSCSYHLM